MALYASSLILGSLLVLNQFGHGVASFLYPLVDLEPISLIWEMNAQVMPRSGQGIIAPLSLLVGALLVLLATRHGDIKAPLVQGTLTGFLVVPMIGVLIVAIMIVMYVLFILGKMAWFVFGVISIPFLWLWNNVLFPLLGFLATPLAWLWDNYLSDPFLWLWREILQPLFAVIALVISMVNHYLVLPLMIAVMLVLGVVGLLLPVAALGLVGQNAALRAFGRSTSGAEAFGAGVALGISLFDTAMLATLALLGEVPNAIPVSQLALLILALLLVLRVIWAKVKTGETAQPNQQQYVDRLAVYWRESRLEFMAGCIGASATLVMAGVPAAVWQILTSVAQTFEMEDA